MKVSNFYTNTTMAYGKDMRFHLLSAPETLIFSLPVQKHENYILPL